MKRIVIGVPSDVTTDPQLRERPLTQVEIVVPQYAREYGVWQMYDDIYYLKVQQDGHGATVISADKQGLINLARDLLEMAQDEVPVGAHIHYDRQLEPGSSQMIIGKAPPAEIDVPGEEMRPDGERTEPE